MENLDTLIDDLKTIIIETEFNRKWIRIEGYHLLGQRLIEALKDTPRTEHRQILQHVAKKLPYIGERTLYLTIQFVKKYPELDKLPYGKAISWRKIATQLLPEPREKEEAQAKPTINLSRPKKSPFIKQQPGFSSFKSYEEFVEHCSCVVCGSSEVEKAHWPVTRKAGGKEVENWIIPLCHQCHMEYHQYGHLTFYDHYYKAIARYFYGIINEIWNK